MASKKGGDVWWQRRRKKEEILDGSDEETRKIYNDKDDLQKEWTRKRSDHESKL